MIFQEPVTSLNPVFTIGDQLTAALRQHRSTTARDVSVQSQILDLLLDLRREFDLSIALASHNLAIVEHMATHVGVMPSGEAASRNQ